MSAPVRRRGIAPDRFRSPLTGPSYTWGKRGCFGPSELTFIGIRPISMDPMSVETQSPRFVRPSVSRGFAGGSLGGVIGAILFGLLIWTVSPEAIGEAIPGVYGLEESAAIGWGLHLIHGLILGGLFGLVATRPIVFDIITGPVETDILKGLSANARFGLLGLVYGIAIWTIVPFIGLSLIGGLAAFDDVGFPGLAADMIIGHVLYGVVVGIVYSLFVPASREGLEP